MLNIGLRGFDENENTGRYYLLITQASVSEAIPEKAKQIIESQKHIPYEVIARIIKDGQKEGSIKPNDAKDMALVFWTSIKGLAINKAIDGSKFKTPDQILLRMFI